MAFTWVKSFCLLVAFLQSHIVLSAAFTLSTNHQRDYLARWKDIGKTIYDGNSGQELLEMCPNGCDTTNCSSFPVYLDTGGTQRSPCTDEDIVVLRIAQEMMKDWNEAIEYSHKSLIPKLILVGIVVILIFVLIFRGHYRFKDLWFLPSDRQWQFELDPTWGLPGKVWNLLKIRVVKSKKGGPTERKFFSYTDNPTIMGNKFWYYKHALRDMYTRHKYYKRNRYFHKLAWQVTKLRQIVPETLRRRGKGKRHAGDLEGAISPEPQPERHINLPWEIDLAEELNQVQLRTVKKRIEEIIKKDKAEGVYTCGRYPEGHQMRLEEEPPRRHHHHHKRKSFQKMRVEEDRYAPMGKEELEMLVKERWGNRDDDYIMVDEQLKLHPISRKLHRHLKHERNKEKKNDKDGHEN